MAVLSSSSQLLGRSKIPMEMQAESLKSTDSELELELGCPAPSGRDGRHLEWEMGTFVLLGLGGSSHSSAVRHVMLGFRKATRKQDLSA